MRLALRWVFTCLLLVTPAAAEAAEVLDSSVSKNGNCYRATISIRIDAPLTVVYGAFTDYEHLVAMNPDIVESRVLESAGPDKDRVYSVIRVCILVFCKRLVHVQDVERRQDGSILAITRPAESDFSSGVARWRFTAQGASTLMHFTQEFEPDFWVPPVIGPWLIERKLVEEVEVAARYIEGLAL